MSPVPLTIRRVATLWWPLAASWLLMGAELPMFVFVVARLADPEVHLAAYGSLVFPIALLIEAPIIMLLAASTALSRDRDSYAKVRRFMLTASVLLTLVHIAVAFTPLYDVVAVRIMNVPEPVLEPARIGLRIMTPWTWAIAYRRFQQGLLIRVGRARDVSLGTLTRLTAGVTVLAAGYAVGDLPGIVVGTSAIAAGVVTEALFVGWRVRPWVRALAPPSPGDELLSRAAFLRFYVPLALTPLLTLLIQPIGAAAMNRMPMALLSTAAWPAVHGLVFLMRGVGMAFNEVVVTVAGEPGALPVLRRFTWRLAAGTTLVLSSLALTPLSGLWFEHVQKLAPELAELARIAVMLAMLMPAYAAAQSLFMGVLMHGRTTRAIPEAVALYLGIVSVLLALGIAYSPWPGIYVAIVSFTVGGVIQTLWLARRSARLRAELEAA